MRLDRINFGVSIIGALLNLASLCDRPRPIFGIVAVVLALRAVYYAKKLRFL